MDIIKLLVIPGEGIGPEITAASLKVLNAVKKRFNLPIAIEKEKVGMETWKKHGTTIPNDILKKAKAADGLILGPLSHNEYPSILHQRFSSLQKTTKQHEK